jgi:hypothetical protein
VTRGRFTLLVVAVGVVAVIAVTGVAIDLPGGDDEKKSEPAARTTESTSTTPTATTGEPEHAENRRREVSKLGADPDVVRGSEEIALNRPRNLERALGVLERRRVKAEGIFEDLRIAPGRIDTQVRNGHEIINLQIRTDFSIPFSNRIDFPGNDDVIARGLRARDVDVQAPALLLRKIDRRRDGATAASDLDYMVVQRGLIDHKIGWSVFLKRGPKPRAWRGEGRGLELTPIG